LSEKSEPTVLLILYIRSLKVVKFITIRVEVEVEQSLTSHRTHYGYRDGFYGSNDPTNSVKALIDKINIREVFKSLPLLADDVSD